jgi:hypothetical protein
VLPFAAEPTAVALPEDRKLLSRLSAFGVELLLAAVRERHERCFPAILRCSGLGTHLDLRRRWRIDGIGRRRHDFPRCIPDGQQTGRGIDAGGSEVRPVACVECVYAG